MDLNEVFESSKRLDSMVFQCVLDSFPSELLTVTFRTKQKAA